MFGGFRTTTICKMQFDMTMSEIRVVCQVPNLRDEKALEQKAAARDLAL